MKTVSIVNDVTCLMNSQIWGLLHVLSVNQVGVPDTWYVETRRYYNGRERGFCISIRDLGQSQATNFVFYEHRNSDEICCVKFPGNVGENYVTSEDIPEEYFKDKYSYTASWGYMEFAKVREYLVAEIESLISNEE